VSFRLAPSRPVAGEVRRVVDRQLARAILLLHVAPDGRHDNAIHEARRHIKKARAALGLIGPAAGEPGERTLRRLRLAHRMLAPIADGRAVVAIADSLVPRAGRRASASLIAVHRVAAARAARIDRNARSDRLLPRVARILRAERARLRAAPLPVSGFGSLAAGLATSMRRSRKAMKRAERHPTAEHYHSWRCRVKELWFHMRLIEARCGPITAIEARRLEALDGVLGTYHNIVLLERLLMTEAIAPRNETARILHLLRRYQSELRLRAALLGRRTFAVKPKRYVRRLRLRWQREDDALRRPERRRTWPRAA
jgi:CHAD domain-containing protein